MALTKLDPNVIGQDSTGAGKITSAGGSVSIDSSGNVRIANNSANSILFAANGTVGFGASTIVLGSNASPSSYNSISISTANGSGYRSDIWGSGGTVNPSFEQYVYDRQAGTGNQEVAYMTGRLNGSGKGTWNFQTKTSTSWMNTMTMLDGYVGIGTTAPDQLLKIHGAGSPAIVIRETGGSVNTLLYSNASMGFTGTQTAHDFGIKTGDTVRVTIQANGVPSFTSNRIALNQGGTVLWSASGSTGISQGFSVTVPAVEATSCFVVAIHNHYGLLSGYGASRVSVLSNGNGGMSEINIQNSTSGNGGSWTFSNASSSSFTITKNAGTYGGGGYYTIFVVGNYLG